MRSPGVKQCVQGIIYGIDIVRSRIKTRMCPPSDKGGLSLQYIELPEWNAEHQRQLEEAQLIHSLRGQRKALERFPGVAHFCSFLRNLVF